MEAMGDITASAEVSRVEVEGEEFESRIQGGVLVSLTPVSHWRGSKHQRNFRAMALEVFSPLSSQ